MDHSKHSASVFNKLAKQYQARFMDTRIYHETFDVFCNALPKNGTVLELACGPGNITQYLLLKRPDLNILATDLAPEMVKLAAMNNTSAQFQVLDCRSISNLQQKYDAVMCGFVLPYISVNETQQLICDVAMQLNPNGIFYISTIEGKYSDSGFRKGSTGEEIFMHYYDTEFLAESLRQNGFEIVVVKKIDATMTGGSAVTDLVIISVKPQL